METDSWYCWCLVDSSPHPCLEDAPGNNIVHSWSICCHPSSKESQADAVNAPAQARSWTVSAQRLGLDATLSHRRRNHASGEIRSRCASIFHQSHESCYCPPSYYRRHICQRPCCIRAVHWTLISRSYQTRPCGIHGRSSPQPSSSKMYSILSSTRPPSFSADDTLKEHGDQETLLWWFS